MPVVPEEFTAHLTLLVPLLKSVLIALLTLVLGWWVSKWANRLLLGALRARSVDEALCRFLASLAQYAVLGATVIAALGAVGVETTSAMALFASAGLAVGLALQGTLSSFASGVLILLFRPFQLGDIIEVDGQTGKVSDIGLFTTILETPAEIKIIVPNALITGGTIVNHTGLGRRRGEVEVGVAYGEDLKRVHAALLGAAARTSLALQDPAPLVIFSELGASSLNFKVMAWCPPDSYRDMLHELRCNVYDALAAENIEIPFNQVVVHQAAS